jgi:hypothetical protein
MLDEYYAIVHKLPEQEREALRTEWQQVLSNALEDEGKAMSAVARLKRAEKKMLNAVRVLKNILPFEF